MRECSGKRDRERSEREREREREREKGEKGKQERKGQKKERRESARTRARSVLLGSSCTHDGIDVDGGQGLGEGCQEFVHCLHVLIVGTEDWVPALLRVSPAPRDAAYCTHRSSMTPCERTSSSRSRPGAVPTRSTAARISRATLTRGSPSPVLLSQRTVTSARRCSDGPDCDQR